MVYLASFRLLSKKDGKMFKLEICRFYYCIFLQKSLLWAHIVISLIIAHKLRLYIWYCIITSCNLQPTAQPTSTLECHHYVTWQDPQGSNLTGLIRFQKRFPHYWHKGLDLFFWQISNLHQAILTTRNGEGFENNFES